MARISPSPTWWWASCFNRVQLNTTNSYIITQTHSPHLKTICVSANLDEKSKLRLSRDLLAYLIYRQVLTKPTSDVARRRPSQSEQFVYLENGLTQNRHILHGYLCCYFWSEVIAKAVENAASDSFVSNFCGVAFCLSQPIGGLLVVLKCLLRFDYVD